MQINTIIYSVEFCKKSIIRRVFFIVVFLCDKAFVIVFLCSSLPLAAKLYLVPSCLIMRLYGIGAKVFIQEYNFAICLES